MQIRSSSANRPCVWTSQCGILNRSLRHLSTGDLTLSCRSWFLRFIVLVLNLSVPLRWMLDECRHTTPLIKPYGNTGLVMDPGICVLVRSLSCSYLLDGLVGRAEALSCLAFLGQVLSVLTSIGA